MNLFHSEGLYKEVEREIVEEKAEQVPESGIFQRSSELKAK